MWGSHPPVQAKERGQGTGSRRTGANTEAFSGHVIYLAKCLLWYACYTCVGLNIMHPIDRNSQ